MAEQLLMKNKKLLHSSILNVARPVVLWNGGLTSTAQQVSISIDKIKDITNLELDFAQMGNTQDTIVGTEVIRVPLINTTIKYKKVGWFSIGSATEYQYISSGTLSYQQVGTDLIIKWVNKGWQAINSSTGTLSLTNANTIDNGLSLVRIAGYEALPLVNIYKKAEVDTLLSNKYNKTETYTKTEANAITDAIKAKTGTTLTTPALSVAMTIQKRGGLLCFSGGYALVNNTIPSNSTLYTISESAYIPNTTFHTGVWNFTSSVMAGFLQIQEDGVIKYYGNSIPAQANTYFQAATCLAKNY
jgi:hypothetical protein